MYKERTGKESPLPKPKRTPATAQLLLFSMYKERQIIAAQQRDNLNLALYDRAVSLLAAGAKVESPYGEGFWDTIHLVLAGIHRAVNPLAMPPQTAGAEDAEKKLEGVMDWMGKPLLVTPE